ncbi:MAG: chorismate-binding protein [Bacteroidia bacterium]
MTNFRNLLLCIPTFSIQQLPAVVLILPGVENQLWSQSFSMNDVNIPHADQGFAAWSAPGDEGLQLMSGRVERITINTMGFKGFVVAPFEAKGNVSLIQPHHHLYLNADDLHSYSTRFSFYHKESNGLEAGAAQFQELVGKALSDFRNEGIIKVVLSRTERWPLPPGFDPWKLFLQLIKRHPDAFVALISLPEYGTWIGASPELLLRVEQQGLETMAMAGTKPVAGADTFTDKERKEQQMVLDFILEKMEAQKVTGKATLAEIVQAGNILHLRSRITSETTENWRQLLEALHPTPAICGTPAFEANEYIRQNEGYDRELYGGFWGPVTEENRAMFYVNLRTMQVLQHEAWLYAGVGIIDGSEPEKEWEETVAKMETMKKALQQYEQ